MSSTHDQIQLLSTKLDVLIKKHHNFSKEIADLQEAIKQLQLSETKPQAIQKDTKGIVRAAASPIEHKQEKAVVPPTTTAQQQTQASPATPKSKKSPKTKSNLEKFIGENLINKIGIIITIIGVAIGAKYTIENDLISPLTRIILGYLTAIGLLGFGIKLKKKYNNYSAVLVSGAIAIMYFITYAAYSFYGLLPQSFAFALMLIFTVFTVAAAINYDNQVIAHIGLVGAYAVPFLLSEGSGRIDILFSYMLIINIGILVIAFKRHWKPLYYVSFLLTWIIYFTWYASDYDIDQHFALALTFLSLFFITFYITFLAYKLIQKEQYKNSDMLLPFANSFIFYGIGYTILVDHEIGKELLGLFTLANGIIHFVVSLVIYKRELGDKNLLYFISGLVLIFITIAIPVQLDGNWVTLLWASEAALLFWIGRSKKVSIHETMSYVLMVLAVISIAHDWSTVYDTYVVTMPETRITPIFNINFLTSLLTIAAFGFILYLDQYKKYQSSYKNKKDFLKIVSFCIPTSLIILSYAAFRIEISTYWQQLYLDSSIFHQGSNHSNYDLKDIKVIWIINYTLLFLAILSFINIKKIKSKLLGILNLVLNTFSIIVFLSAGLYALSELRESYLSQSLSEYYEIGIYHISIRYISFAFAATILIACYKYIFQDFMKAKLKIAFDILFHITLLWITSSELIHWMDMAESTQSYKLGLSILWGLYSLFLIAFGIWRKKKHMRIGGFIIFTITLLKLFLYDIAHLGTIAKTIVFLSLGILLLIISFLYNKYKHIIADEDEN